MGYTTQIELSFYKEEDITHINVDSVNDFLEEMEDSKHHSLVCLYECSCEATWCGETGWCDLEHFKPLMEKFPYITFKLELDGEESGDFSEYYLFDGKIEEATNIKPSFDKDKLTHVSVDDWEGYYFNDELIDQTHTVQLYSILEYLITNKINMASVEYYSYYLEEDMKGEDEDSPLDHFGNQLPSSFKELNDYYKFR